jgi:hypothetical protein
MKLYLLFLVVVFWSCGAPEKRQSGSIKDEYLRLDSSFTKRENFNDSICQVAIDSASRRFNSNKFELYAFLPADSSETPLHILQDRFKVSVIGFAEMDLTFRFCFNEGMISEFERQHKFNLMDSIRSIYDSLDRLGKTNITHKFGQKANDLVEYINCNLEYPEGTELVPPYPKVVVKFRVGPLGKPDRLEIIEAFSAEYDSAAMRVIRLMPNWRPRRNEDGEYDPVYYFYHIRFNPTERDKYCR